jgi:uncharacterized protein
MEKLLLLRNGFSFFMSSELWHRLLLCSSFLLVTDLVLYLGLRRIFIRKKKKNNSGKRFTLGYFLFTLLFIAYAITHYLILRYSDPDFTIYRQYMIIASIFLVIYLPKAIGAIFIIIEYFLLFLFQISSFLMQNRRHYEFVKSVRRFKLLSWMGIIAGICMFIFVLYGIFGMRKDYKVVEETLSFYNLPASFDGMKIALISDAHLGSFFSPGEVEPMISLIKAKSPDLIVFAGDMIDVEVQETLPYVKMFSDLKAPFGKFSILGNHDLGDYMKFYEPNQQGKIAGDLMKAEKEMGFTVIRNGHVFLHKRQDSVALIGLDSWDLPPFKKNGDLDKSINGIDPRTFKILISHSPSQWTAEVRGRTDVDLTLSGHTHAMQIGINLFGIKWSPSTFRYPKWMGLYRWGTQYLYVNPGFGYLGFIGRIGIRPEITLLTLRKG